MMSSRDIGDELVDDCVAVITSVATHIYGRQSKRRAEQIKQCVEQVMQQ